MSHPRLGQDRQLAPRLEVSALTRRFGERVAVRDVGFTVSSGEIVGLVGRNGAGKTTTMRTIMGLMAPDAGSVSWAGEPVGAVARHVFGYMPEERGLYPQMAVLKQIAYFATLQGLPDDDALLAASTWVQRLGLAGREDEKLVGLSHGNQQRVQLAVAVVHRPQVLVLDEPFSGLDPAAVDSLSGILRALAVDDGAAVLFSSHQLELVERLCDRIVILEAGRVLADGSLSELRKRVPQRLRIKVDAPSGWALRVPGVEVVDDGPEGVLFVLPVGDNGQRLLRAALKAGPVEHFGFVDAELVDLYRTLVAA